MKKYKRINFNLTKESVDKLEYLKNILGEDATGVLRMALNQLFTRSAKEKLSHLLKAEKD
jgi:hypothetical protein